MPSATSCWFTAADESVPAPTGMEKDEVILPPAKKVLPSVGTLKYFNFTIIIIKIAILNNKIIVT